MPQKRSYRVTVKAPWREEGGAGGMIGCLNIPATEGPRGRLRAVTGKERGDDGGADEQTIAAGVRSDAAGAISGGDARAEATDSGRGVFDVWVTPQVIDPSIRSLGAASGTAAPVRCGGSLGATEDDLVDGRAAREVADRLRLDAGPASGAAASAASEGTVRNTFGEAAEGADSHSHELPGGGWAGHIRGRHGRPLRRVHGRCVCVDGDTDRHLERLD